MSSGRKLIPLVLLALSGTVFDAPGVQDDSLRLPAPLYPEVLALADAGRPVDALTRLEQEGEGDDGRPVEAVALRARLLADAGRHAESAAAWDAVARREAVLTRTALTEAAEAYIHAGDLDRAAQVVSELSRTDADRLHELQLMLATALRTAGRAADAERVYRRLLDRRRAGALADAARVGLALALDDSGRRADAIQQLREVQQSFRDPRAYADARRHEARILDALGLERARFTEGEYREMAERLARAAQFAAANELLAEWRERHPDTAEAGGIEAMMVGNLYNLRENDEAMRQAGALLRRDPDGPFASEMQVMQFRLDVREGRTDQVRARGRPLWRGRTLRAGLRDDIGRLLAAYLVSVGEVDEGLAVYRELYRQARSRGAQADILWRAGVAAFRDGQLERARVNLEGVLARRPGPETEALARYWLARTEARAGRHTRAARFFTALADAARFDYYTMQATSRLAELQGPDPESRAGNPTLTFPDRTPPSGLSEDPDYRAFTRLARAGLWPLAARHARELASRRGATAIRLLAIRASIRGDDYRAAQLLMTRFRRYAERPTAGAPPDLLALAYPRAFWDEVRAAAEKEDVDPYLLLAIMKQESVFDPRARSPVGAIGLFQVMPYTAEAIGPAVGYARPDEEQLMRPAVSAAIAARLLHDLLDRYDGEVAPAVAAYNAGEDRVDVWWKAARPHGADMFVDSIPYGQTRRYVRTVLGGYTAYRAIYGAMGNVECGMGNQFGMGNGECGRRGKGEGRMAERATFRIPPFHIPPHSPFRIQN